MTRELLVTVAIVAIALAAPIGIKTAEAHGGAYADDGFHGERSRGGDFHDRGSFERREFRGNVFRFGGIVGGYYPGYHGYGPCYRTVYGTIACY
jgi:hypothetical protein